MQRHIRRRHSRNAFVTPIPRMDDASDLAVQIDDIHALDCCWTTHLKIIILERQLLSDGEVREVERLDHPCCEHTQLGNGKVAAGTS